MIAGLPLIGETLSGKYQLVGILGEGGMACVYEALHTKRETRVAIKMLTPELARDPQIVTRFQREARVIGLLRSRHVAHVLEVDVTSTGIPFIVMEFLEGRDLEAELDARGALPLSEVVDYVLQACAAMIEAHASGIIHRDLKPANLFVTSGTERVVKVIDFGISKMIGEATRLTGAGAVMGTVLYMPPEQIRATTDVDHRADIWAMGVILFELLAGRAPWEGVAHKVAAEIVSSDAPDVRKFAPVSEGVANVIRKMLQRNPDARFASIAEVVRALEPFAPPNSIGAAVAQEVAMSTSARMRNSDPALGPRQAQTMPLSAVPMSKMTLPMANAPSSRREPPSHREPASARAPISTREPPPSMREPPSQGSQRTAFLVGFFLMLLVAGGVVVAVILLRKPVHVPIAPPATAVISTPVTTPSAVMPTATAATESSTSSATSPIPAPPPTGTTRPQGATPSASSAAHPTPKPTASPAPTNPTHL